MNRPDIRPNRKVKDVEVETKQMVETDFIKVNAEGYMEDVVLVPHVRGENPTPPDEFHVLPWGDKRLFRPRYDFASQTWVEGEPPEVVAEREDEILSHTGIVEAQRYLDETDWYVTREMETGKPIPSDVRAKREHARVLLSNMK